MIPPEFISRFAGDTGADVASMSIDVVFPDGERRRVVLRIGAPFLQDGMWRVRTELENLDRTDGPIGGNDPMHALILGIAWLPARLRVFAERLGCRYFWPDSDDVFDYQECFRIPLPPNQE